MTAGSPPIRKCSSTNCSTALPAASSWFGRSSTLSAPGNGKKPNRRTAPRATSRLITSPRRKRKLINNCQFIHPYAAPYLAYVGIAFLPAQMASPEINYLLRLIIAPLLLASAWRWYCPFKGPRSLRGSILTGIGAGLTCLVLWLGLLTPFVHADGASSWSFQEFFLRLLSASLVVPLFEELMMRGFVFRLALQWDLALTTGDKEPLHTTLDTRSVNDVAPGAWSWPVVVLSTLAFTSGHAMAEWPAHGLAVGQHEGSCRLYNGPCGHQYRPDPVRLSHRELALLVRASGDAAAKGSASTPLQ